MEKKNIPWGAVITCSDNRVGKGFKKQKNKKKIGFDRLYPAKSNHRKCIMAKSNVLLVV